MRKTAILILLSALTVFGQQPSSLAPISNYNVKAVQGVGPGYWATAGSGMTLNISKGSIVCNGTTPVTYAGGTLTMTASQTNYVYLDSSASCVPASNITGFSVSNSPIAIVTAGSSSISVSDWRPMGVRWQGSSACGLGNCTTVIDASTVAGANFSDKVNAAFAACGTCTVDSRGLTSSPAMTADIIVPQNSTLILPATSIETNGHHLYYRSYSTILGQGMMTSKFTASAGYGTFVVQPYAEPGGFVYYPDLENFGIYNTGAGSGSGGAFAVGQTGTDVADGYFKNLFTNSTFATSVYGVGCTCYNVFVNLRSSGSSYGLKLWGTQSNTNKFYGGLSGAAGVGGDAVYDTGAENQFFGMDNDEYGNWEVGGTAGGEQVFGGYLNTTMVFDLGAVNTQVFGFPSHVTDNSGNLTNTVNGLVNGTFVNQATYQLTCTGTATANTTIYFLGAEGTAATCTSTSSGGPYGVSPRLGSGTIYKLVVGARTGGISALSGVVTVGTAVGGDTLLTCTLGTGLACSDLTDSVNNLNSAFYVKMTTQPGESLANITVQLSFR